MNDILEIDPATGGYTYTSMLKWFCSHPSMGDHLTTFDYMVLGEHKKFEGTLLEGAQLMVSFLYKFS